MLGFRPSMRPARKLMGSYGLILTIVFNTANANEVKTHRSGRHSSAASNFEDYKVDGVTQLSLPDSTIDIGSKMHIPTNAKDTFSVGCKDFESEKKGSGETICADQVKHAEMFESASKAFGIPAAILVCMTGVESRFIPNNPSQDGAHSQGLVQVTASTAPLMAKLFNSDRHKFQSRAWADFTKDRKWGRSSSALTEASVRSPDIKDADVEIFTMAMYLRNSLNEQADMLKEKDFSTMEGVKKLAHFLIAAYNGGDGLGRKFLNSGMSDTSVPADPTQKYFTRFDKCMDKMATGR